LAIKFIKENEFLREGRNQPIFAKATEKNLGFSILPEALGIMNKSVFELSQIGSEKSRAFLKTG
jgi:hypothetical protein